MELEEARAQHEQILTLLEEQAAMTVELMPSNPPSGSSAQPW